MSNFLAGGCFVLACWCADDREYKYAIAFIFLAVIHCVEAIGK